MKRPTADPAATGAPVSADRAARLMRLATYASVTVSLILISAKAVVLAYTGSVALLSSLVDSTLDLVASIVNLVAVGHALTPADREHRFGHGKAESLAALGQAALVAASAVFLIWAASSRLIRPAAVTEGAAGIAVMVGSMVLTGALVAFQRYVVRRTGSIAIAADQLHYTSDFLMNAAVIAALALAFYGGWLLADPLFAIAIAIYILYSAWAIFRGALDQLMDHELPEAERRRIREIALSHADVRQIHDLRTRTSGTRSFIQLHLELDGAMTLYRAHVIADTVEAEIQQAFPGAEVIIHQDPAGLEDDLTDLART